MRNVLLALLLLTATARANILDMLATAGPREITNGTTKLLVHFTAHGLMEIESKSDDFPFRIKVETPPSHFHPSVKSVPCVAERLEFRKITDLDHPEGKIAVFAQLPAIARLLYHFKVAHNGTAYECSVEWSALQGSPSHHGVAIQVKKVGATGAPTDKILFWTQP